MTSKYFYKGIDMNLLLSNGDDGNPTSDQTTAKPGYLLLPNGNTDSKGFSQVQNLGYIDSNGKDIGKLYTTFYETVQTTGATQIDLVNQSIKKTVYDSISAVLIGGSGGGGGGGGAGFENRAPSGTNSGWSGNGGGGGGLAALTKTSITDYNQLYLFVGAGGGDGEGGLTNPNGDGQAGQNGQDGQLSNLSGQNGTNQTQLAIANGGEGGYGGYPGYGSSSASGANTSQGAGGTGTVTGTAGTTSSARQTPGQGGDVGASSTYPVIITGTGGDGGQFSGNRNVNGGDGQKGSDGCIRIYFFRS